MTVYDRLWQTMTDYDRLWQIITYYDILWQIMTEYDRLGQIMTDYDKLWQIMTDYDRLWLIMTYFDRLWLIMTDYDSFNKYCVTSNEIWTFFPLGIGVLGVVIIHESQKFKIWASDSDYTINYKNFFIIETFSHL